MTPNAMAQSVGRTRTRSQFIHSMLMVLVAVSAASPAVSLAAEEDLVVAVLDTGIEGNHPEFVPGQIRAWRDFTKGVEAPWNQGPWDSRSPPADGCPIGSGCHGTAMASLVGGARFGAYPGVALAVGRVVDDSGDVAYLAEAIRWAVSTAGAQVILLSLGGGLPSIGALEEVDEAIAEAHHSGTLVVVAAGNGFLGNGPRTTSLTNGPAISTHALVVGASGWSASAEARVFAAPWSNLDPHVLAWGVEVPAASGGRGLALWSGTSVSAALTAGWSAALLAAAQDWGISLGPRQAKELLVRSAHDLPDVAPNVEGYGFIDQYRASPHDTVSAAIFHAKAGTTGPAPSLATAAWMAMAQHVRTLGDETLDP